MITQQKWSQLSFAQRMGHIGSELSRARHWEARGDGVSQRNALGRALELVDLTLECEKHFPRLKELTRLREVICDWYCGSQYYEVSHDALLDYCTQFAMRI